jgi:hypothetical protein
MTFTIGFYFGVVLGIVVIITLVLLTLKQMIDRYEREL